MIDKAIFGTLRGVSTVLGKTQRAANSAAGVAGGAMVGAKAGHALGKGLSSRGHRNSVIAGAAMGAIVGGAAAKEFNRHHRRMSAKQMAALRKAQLASAEARRRGE